MYDQHPHAPGPEPEKARTPPHNIEAEQALLGAMMLNNEVLDLCALEEADFFDPVHGRIFAAIRKITGLGRTADAVTLRNMFVADEGMAVLGGPVYLARLAGVAVPASGAALYASSIKDLRRRRDALQALAEAEDSIYAMDELPDAVAALESALSDTEGQTQSVVSFAQASDAAYERMNDAYHGKKLPGVDLQIPDLTEKIGNVLPGDMILLGARPSMGKSAIAIEIARRCAKAGIAVPYWCGEMAPEDNAERIIAAETAEAGVRVSYHLARRGRMNEDQFKALLHSGTGIQNLPIDFVEPSIKRIDRVVHEIRRRARRHQAEGRPVLAVVDYLQIIRGTGKSRYEDVTEISQALKAMAIELRIPVLVLSQLSRQVEQRDNKRPVLSDLRESGQIEQDANTVIFCYRDEYYLERLSRSETDENKRSAMIAALEHVKGHMELIIAKQRSGPLDTVTVKFDGAINSIGRLSEPATDSDQKDFYR